MEGPVGSERQEAGEVRGGRVGGGWEWYATDPVPPIITAAAQMSPVSEVVLVGVVVVLWWWCWWCEPLLDPC